MGSAVQSTTLLPNKKCAWYTRVARFLEDRALGPEEILESTQPLKVRSTNSIIVDLILLVRSRQSSTYC